MNVQKKKRKGEESWPAPWRSLPLRCLQREDGQPRESNARQHGQSTVRVDALCGELGGGARARFVSCGGVGLSPHLRDSVFG